MPAFTSPPLVFSLNAATPASTAIYGGQALHWTSQQDWHAAAGRTLAMAAGGSAGLYSQQGGLKAIAQAGSVSIQAHQGPLEWMAQDNITVTSSGEDVEILAQGKVRLAAGEVSIELDGENITLTMPGLLDIKGVTKSFVGPGGSPAALPVLPINSHEMFSEQFHLVAQDDETPLPGHHYRITASNGETWEGISDEDGLTIRVFTHEPLQLTVEILDANDIKAIE